MAEAIARDMGHDAQSAGTDPGECVAGEAMDVLSEIGVGTSGLFPKSVDSIDSEGFDRIISMGCGVHCPLLPIDDDWGLEDPVGRGVSFYRETRGEILERVSKLE
jgi:protein-tyrosine-phosphatase